jgi:hypothetical protein
MIRERYSSTTISASPTILWRKIRDNSEDLWKQADLKTASIRPAIPKTGSKQPTEEGRRGTGADLVSPPRPIRVRCGLNLAVHAVSHSFYDTGSFKR